MAVLTPTTCTAKWRGRGRDIMISPLRIRGGGRFGGLGFRVSRMFSCCTSGPAIACGITGSRPSVVGMYTSTCRIAERDRPPVVPINAITTFPAVRPLIQAVTEGGLGNPRAASLEVGAGQVVERDVGSDADTRVLAPANRAFSPHLSRTREGWAIIVRWIVSSAAVGPLGGRRARRAARRSGVEGLYSRRRFTTLRGSDV